MGDTKGERGESMLDVQSRDCADCTIPQVDGDSGYGGSSDASLASQNPGPEVARINPGPGLPQQPSGSSCPLSRPPQLRVIAKPIDDRTGKRAEDVIERISGLLEEYMTKGKKPSCPMAIRLAMVGTVEENAKPCLLIFCDDSKGRHGKIKRFLKKPRAISLYRPDDPTLPSFEVHVTGPPPTHRSAVEIAIPLHKIIHGSSACTFCGTPIYFVQEDRLKKQRATGGGLIQLDFPDSTRQIFGLTVAHIAADLAESDDGSVSISDECSDIGSSITGSTENSEYESSTSAEFVWDSDHDPMQLGVEHDIWFQAAPELVTGPLTLTALTTASDGLFRDWALFSLPSELLVKPNMLQLGGGQQPGPLKAPVALKTSSDSRPVVIMTGSSGPKVATLSPCLGRAILKPRASFVRVYVVELSDTSDVCHGDSGSWVVDQLTFEVYGHLVATDQLQGCYVVPLVDTFDDIATCFAEASIGFPSATSSSLFRASEESMTLKNSSSQTQTHSDEMNVVEDLDLMDLDEMSCKSTSDWTEPQPSIMSSAMSTISTTRSSIVTSGSTHPPKSPQKDNSAREDASSSSARSSSSMQSSLWTDSALRKISRLYVYTTLPLTKIIEIANFYQPYPPGKNSANKKLSSLFNKEPRWLHPRNEKDMKRRLEALGESPSRRNPQRGSVNPDAEESHDYNTAQRQRNTADDPSMEGVECTPVVQADELQDVNEAPKHSATGSHRRTSIATLSVNFPSRAEQVLSGYSEDYVADVMKVAEGFSLSAESDTTEQLEYNADLADVQSTRGAWIHDADQPVIGSSPRPIAGDILNLDSSLEIQGYCGPGLHTHDSRSCFCYLRDEIVAQKWIEESGPTSAAARILSPNTFSVDDLSQRDPLGNTALHLLAARGVAHERLLEAIAAAPKVVLEAENTAGQTFLHLLSPSWFMDLTGKDAALPKLLNRLVQRDVNIYARDIYGRSVFHILQANVRDPSILGNFLHAYDEHLFARRDAFGLVPTGALGHTMPGRPLQRGDGPVADQNALLGLIREAHDDPEAEDWYGRNGLQCLADVILSLPTLNERYGRHGTESSKVSGPRHGHKDPGDSSTDRLAFRMSNVGILVGAGVDVNHYDNNGNTVLMTFVAQLPEDGDHKLPVAIIEQLIMAGAKINARNRSGETALHVAVRTGKTLAMRTLVRAGANIFVRDGEGRSLLEVTDVKTAHTRNVANYARYEAARAWLSGVAEAVQDPTMMQEWGDNRSES